MYTIHSKHKQSGAALVVGLIILLIMTLLGVSSMSATTTELKIANNLQTSNAAWQAAEAAIQNIAQPNPASAALKILGWNSSVAQPLPNILVVSIPSGTVTANANLVYADCMNAPLDYDIASSDQEGNSSSNKGVIQEATVNVTITSSSSTPIGQAQNRVSGIKTIYPGCP